jgi:hypothetical protein
MDNRSRPGGGNSNIETRNPKQAEITEIPNSKPGERRFEHSAFDIWICFGFRNSDFGFIS